MPYGLVAGEAVETGVRVGDGLAVGEGVGEGLRVGVAAGDSGCIGVGIAWTDAGAPQPLENALKIAHVVNTMQKAYRLFVMVIPHVASQATTAF
ncbi:MAG: hypothetical protein M1482_09755 [Chloroflexi bacterium]|nr:hypothetical protein [Chloroflexota bacterium]